MESIPRQLLNSIGLRAELLRSVVDSVREFLALPLVSEVNGAARASDTGDILVGTKLLALGVFISKTSG